MKPSVYVDGEHGTTGLQIISRLQDRDDITLLSIEHDKRHDKEERAKLLNEADFAILCLPDDAAKEAVSMVDEGGGNTRIIDPSTAHRVDDGWVYGFLEWEPEHELAIKEADRVSNPGCYATGAIALLHPLTKTGVLPKDGLVSIQGISGYTGGGKGLIKEIEDQTETAPIFVYSTGLGHKHVPEITKYSGLQNTPIFSPAVGQYEQGMIVQIPLHCESLNLEGNDGKTEVHNTLAGHYKNAEFVKVMSEAEADETNRLDPTKLVGTDIMELYVFGNEQQVNLVAMLDNLGKGASGACVQSLNVMMGK